MTYKFLFGVKVIYNMCVVAFEANSCIDKFMLLQVSTVLSPLLLGVSLEPLFL